MAEASAARPPQEPREPGVSPPDGAPRRPADAAGAGGGAGPLGAAGSPGAGSSGGAFLPGPGRPAAASPGPAHWVRGVAAVPRGPARSQADTSDIPAIEPAAAGARGSSARSRRGGPEPGLMVRRRGRRLRSGAGWTWTGLSFVLVCWGIWAVSVRGTDLLGPLIGLGLVLATGVLLFVLARLLGRTVLEGALGRDRPSAWPSHLTVCGFLVLAGVAFLQQTLWVQDSWQGLGDAGQWLGDAWSRLVDLWPL